MRPIETQVMAHVGRVSEEIATGIAADAVVHIMTLLTDLYSRPDEAVIREYSTNALDANIEAGNPNPIEVTLPTALNANFVVKDQGVGLSVDDLRSIYSQYGTSTKRASDLVTGMLGLGCKSGLTYATQFTIDAVKNGVRTVAVVTKNTDGAGVIKVLDTVATDDPNGVTITIPVDRTQIDSFRERAQKFYRFWAPGTVVVDGREPDLYRNTNSARYLWVDQDILVDSQADHPATSYVVMGNVAYPFAWKGGGISTYGSHNMSVIAWVPMGSVQFTPSREELYMTPHTEAYLEKLETRITEKIEDALLERIGSLTTTWDRVKMWNSWKGYRFHGRRLTLNALASYGLKELDGLPDGRKAFRWYSSHSGGHASTYETLHLGNFIDDHEPIITGYGHRNVTKNARYRLTKFMEERVRPDPLVRSVWLLPDGYCPSQFDGRPNVLTWEDIVNKYDLPARKARQRTETAYTFVKAGVVGSNVGEFDPDGDPLLYVPVAEFSLKPPDRHYHISRGSSLTGTRCVVDLSKKYTEPRFVMLSENQIQKFERLHPDAEKYSVWFERFQQQSIAALSRKDKIRSHLPTGVISFARMVAASGIQPSDPDLRKLLKLAEHTSPELDLCKKYGFPVPEVKDQVVDDIIARYPIAFRLTSTANIERDLMLYIEAKFAA